MLISKQRLMVCLFYISISIQGSLIAYTHQKALIVVPWGRRLFITIASDVCAAPPPMHTAAGLPFTRTHTHTTPSCSHQVIHASQILLTYLWAQSLHHVTEKVIQLFALNVAIICQDSICEFSHLLTDQLVIIQPLIPANSSASVCAFNSFRHSW